jgi:hypothetical protein
MYRGADKSLVRPGMKQARKHVRDARDFNNIETRAVIKLFFLQGKAPKEIHAILTKTLACFLPGQAKDLPAPLMTWVCVGCTVRSYNNNNNNNNSISFIQCIYTYIPETNNNYYHHYHHLLYARYLYLYS